ncbi:MAG: FAD-dependent monooxygenase [Alphaproteobacteria bacterium]|nr:FAD-dependent monooxygenase [Alphaproteobacteria bacterium]
MRILICGGGIGGLAAALALARIGAEVTVFEKRSDTREGGAGIQIGPNGTRILRQLGIAERLQPNIASPQSLCVHDGPSGERLTQLPLGGWLEKRHGAPYWVAHRADLHASLMDAAQAHPLITIRPGIDIQSAKTYPDEVLAVSNGETVGAGDLLVAADGLHSTLRRTIFAAPPPRYCGKSAARSVIPAAATPKGIVTRSVGIWLAPQGHVVHYPVRGGAELAVVVIGNHANGDIDWAREIEPDWVADAVAECAAPVRNLVAASQTWRRWSLAELSPLPAWVRNRTVLLGDAAHPVLPFLAQGAVLALEDAATLARCLSVAQLASNGSLGDDASAAALAAYETARRPRSARVQAASRRNGEIYHLSGPMRTARNMTLRMLPPEKLLAGYDWLYGWKPGD